MLTADQIHALVNALPVRDPQVALTVFNRDAIRALEAVETDEREAGRVGKGREMRESSLVGGPSQVSAFLRLVQEQHMGATLIVHGTHSDLTVHLDLQPLFLAATGGRPQEL